MGGRCTLQAAEKISQWLTENTTEEARKEIPLRQTKGLETECSKSELDARGAWPRGLVVEIYALCHERVILARISTFLQQLFYRRSLLCESKLEEDLLK